MNQEFRKTVNLRKNISDNSTPSRKLPPDKMSAADNQLSKSSEKLRKELTSIKKPAEDVAINNFYKKLFIISLLLLLFLLFWIFFLRNSDKASNVVADKQKEARWYAVKLVNGEVFYGKIADITADPILITNVYYNYDQLINKKGAVDEKINNKNDEKLKIVKRGNETYGPDGTMNIIRSQILYMEPLRQDSEIIKAISNNIR